MSRIAGLLTPNDPVRAAVMAARTDLFPAFGETWKRKTIESGAAVLSWTGWRIPETASEGGVSVVMDGFIYNKDAFPEALNGAAVVMALYRRKGFSGALASLNGDFAVALYDRNKDLLWLGRDRIGLKPLYYTDRPDFFAFASQPRSLLALPDVPKRIDKRFAAVFAGMHYRYFDNRAELSPYEDIRQLPAGHILENAKGILRTSRYWTLHDAPDRKACEADLAGEYRDLLLDSVARRLAAAERPAFTLSGGLDSSSVLSSAVAVKGTRQIAYSSVYDDPTYDETEDIRPMLGTKVKTWNPVRVGDAPDVFGLLKKMAAVHDEPACTATWLSHYLVAQQTAMDGYGALFGGLGGDELNAGEYEHFIFHFADLEAAGRMKDFDHEIKKWAEYHDHPLFKKDRRAAEESLARLVSGGKCLPDRQRLTRYIHAVNPEFYALTDFEPVMEHPFSSYLKNRTYQDIFRETAPSCLRAEDRQTTAFGLDRFDPFFDYRLMEFMFRIPGNMKIRNGRTKHLLRRAMKGLLPEETRTRITKTGWNAPAYRWFSGKGGETLRDLIASRDFREYGLYNIGAVERLLVRHEELTAAGRGQEGPWMFFWQLAAFWSWVSVIKDGA